MVCLLFMVMVWLYGERRSKKIVIREHSRQIHWTLMGEAASSQFPSPTSKSKLEAGSVYFGPAWGRSMICKVDLLLPCLPWQPLRAAHWLLPQMSTVRTHTHAYARTYRNVWLIFSHLFSLLLRYSITCLQTSTISPNHCSWRVLLLSSFFSIVIASCHLLAPGAEGDGRRFLWGFFI